ncbi:hypothetical protein MRB53_008344 [Persea americana]|uniref:Uncharacterized protein n=1 Tax=Persea americana TaxID=3435 RepID=A0ACC2MMF8_PERAE|nr:hypothetical protein MRB53_008344 [Persea americana]
MKERGGHATELIQRVRGLVLLTHALSNLFRERTRKRVRGLYTILSRKSRRSDSRFPIDWSHFVSKSQICCHSNRRKLQVGLQLENKEIFGTRTETEKINVLGRKLLDLDSHIETRSDTFIDSCRIRISDFVLDQALGLLWSQQNLKAFVLFGRNS